MRDTDALRDTVHPTCGIVRRLVIVAITSVAAFALCVSGPPAASASHNNQVICGYWVVGAIKHKYDQHSSILGCPTSSELANPGGTGMRQHFGPRGIIYFKWGAPSARPVWGMILQGWGSKGYERSIYRYPVTDEWVDGWDPTYGSSIWQQNFECGYIRTTVSVTYYFYTCN